MWGPGCDLPCSSHACSRVILVCRCSVRGCCRCLLLATPVMQQGVYLVTFSAPFFVSLWTGGASYLVLVPAILRTRMRRETARCLGATVLMLLSLSCYPMGSMVFAAFALLELVMARKVGSGRSVSPIRFTVRVLHFSCSSRW